MKFNKALLQSLTNPELLSLVYGVETIPQEIAQEMVRRFDDLVTSGQIPDDSDSYKDELEEKENEIRAMRDAIDSAIGALECI